MDPWTQSRAYVNQASNLRTGHWKQLCWIGKIEINLVQSVYNAAIEIGDYDRIEIKFAQGYLAVCFHEIDGIGLDALMPQLWASLPAAAQKTMIEIGCITLNNQSMVAINELKPDSILTEIYNKQIHPELAVFSFREMSVEYYNKFKDSFECVGNWRASGIKNRKGRVKPRLTFCHTAIGFVETYYRVLFDLVETGMLESIKISMLETNAMLETKQLGRPRGSLGARRRAVMGEEVFDAAEVSGD